MMKKLDEWYRVRFDAEKIYREVAPPHGQAWSDEIVFRDIIRVCFKPGDYQSPDEIYIFTNGRDESYLIPTEAAGGLDLWNELIRRNLFDAELAIKCATATEGLFCWPEVE